MFSPARIHWIRQRKLEESPTFIKMRIALPLVMMEGPTSLHFEGNATQPVKGGRRLTLT